MNNCQPESLRNIIGLIPAAGTGSRISPLPCSKEIYPVGFRSLDNNELRPKVVSHYLLESMRSANITRAFIIIREGKWDIPSYFGDGKMVDMSLAYLMRDLPYGVPYTLDQAYPFLHDATVALGFPDMIFEPGNAYSKLFSRLEETGADLVLGLFPAHNPHKTDMVEIDENGKIRSILIKPDQTRLIYAWEIAVWTPVFTKFMHDYVISHNNKSCNTQEERKELHVGDVMQSAIQSNIRIDSVTFDKGTCLDIGTPEDMIRAVQNAGVAEKLH